MDWAKDSATWPNTDQSHIVLCKPHRWHVQTLGDGPTLLLIHGAGGATHSWQHLIPHLTTTHRVVAIDLPGQGFTQSGAQRRCGIDPMANDIIALMQAEGIRPAALIGHSAGAALALRIAELTPIPHIIGINAALDTFQGVAGVLFPALAKTIAALPMAANVFSATASQGQAVARIIQGTGSNLPPDDLELYRRLVASPSHVQATLQMMAQWKLEPLLARLPDMKTKIHLIAAKNDRAVPPDTTIKSATILPNAQAIMLENLGHLAHEEDAGTVAQHILRALNA